MSEPTNTPDKPPKCPKCGAKRWLSRSGWIGFDCGSELLDGVFSQDRKCITSERDQLTIALTAREAELHASKANASSWESCVRVRENPKNVAPCGHHMNQCYSEDGVGRVIRCYVCERDRARANLEALRNQYHSLGSYASSVRIDRLDSTKEFALQTVDWCDGLMELAQAAIAATKEAL